MGLIENHKRNLLELDSVERCDSWEWQIFLSNDYIYVYDSICFSFLNSIHECDINNLFLEQNSDDFC